MTVTTRTVNEGTPGAVSGAETGAEAAVASDIGGAAGVAETEMGSLATKTEKSMKEAETSVKSHSSSMGSSFKTLSSDVSGPLGVVSGAMPLIAAGAGVAVLKMSMDFQSATTQLVTGAGESESALGMVRQGLLDMAGAVGEGPTQLAQGLYTIESAGFHASAGLQVLKTAEEGARVGATDGATMANALTSALNAYHEPASKAVAVTNEMVATVASGKMHMQDLASSISAVLPVAAAAHISFAQVGGAIATMTGQGMSAQQATQNLAGTIRTLQNPSSVAVKEMAAMGLNATTVAQQLGSKGLTGTLGELVSAITSHMGPAGLVLQNAFNQSKSAAADAQTMLQNLPASVRGVAEAFVNGTVTSAEWRKEMKNIPIEQANLARQFATTEKSATGFNDLLKHGGPAAQTFSAALSQMTGGATGLNTSLMLTGDNMATFQTNVQNVSDASKNAGKDVNGWSQVQQDAGQQMKEAWGKVQGALVEVGSKALPFVGGAFQFLAQNMSVFGPLLGIIVAGFAAMKVTGLVKDLWAFGASLVQGAAGLLGFGGAETAAAGAGDALAASEGLALAPMLLIAAAIAAVIAIGVLLITHWKQVSQVAGAVFHDIAQFFEQWVVAPVRTAVGWVTGAFTAAFNTVRNVVSSVLSAVFGFFNTWIIAPIRDVILFFINLWVTAFQVLENVARSVFGAIGGFVDRVTGPIKAVVGAIGSVVGAVGGVVGGIGGFFSHLAGGGQVDPGKWALVGEAGPELAYGGTAGLSIFNRSQVSSAVGQGAGGGVIGNLAGGNGGGTTQIIIDASGATLLSDSALDEFTTRIGNRIAQFVGPAAGLQVHR
ncbi:MAG: phage tail tape measure protein [Candidatus Dormibacteria bacterium]